MHLTKLLSKFSFILLALCLLECATLRFLDRRPTIPSTLSVSRIDKVAIEVLERINPLSIKNDWEYGGRIYFDREKSEFIATPPITDKDAHGIMIPSLRNLGIVDGITIAHYHTHGAKSVAFNDEHFSSIDTTGARTDQYLITPSYRILKYDFDQKRIYEYSRKLDMWVLPQFIFKI